MPISREEWFRRLCEAADKAKEKKTEMDAVLNSNPTGDQAFAGIIGFCSALSAMTIEASKMKRELRAEKRKAKYAVRKSLGLVKTAAQRKSEKDAILAAEREEDRRRDAYVPSSCYCHMGNPPCSWCTREVDEEDDNG